MRINSPITQQEHPFPDGTTLMSTTDTQGRIQYANAAFVQVSGFDRGELLGQPHNIVRHPDMPSEAFADMWRAIRAGEPWTALVKNRRKNGDHYWVRANAAAMRRGGRVVGYISVRTRPSRAEVKQAEPLYKEMRDGRLRGWRLHKGIVVRSGALAWMSAFKRMPVRWRIRSALFAAALAPLAAAAGLGLSAAALGVLAASVAAGAVLACGLLEWQIALPLARIVDEAQRVACGEPARDAHLDRVDEVGLLMRCISQAGLNLRSLVDDVGEQVDGVRTASSEIAQGNSDLSSRTEQAASNLEQTAASMEQMASTLKQNADSARQANQLAASASDTAARGGAAFADVSRKMESITQSSRKIAEIIGVIDSIAFQTNILALNAAVEAARAGEQGRGFAVVAEEVRTLAQRSAQAAREIKQMISESVGNVESGSAIVNDASRTIDQIVTQVRRVTDLIGEIATATVEQSSGVGQVNQAVSQLDQFTQQNAALVEQSAAAAASLSTQARLLADAVAVYSTRA